MALPNHKTKIVCTIGPASESVPVMEQMIEAGMNIARLNFSHGDFAAHKRVIENLRAASAAVGRRIAIMADLSGPKMRIGRIDPEPIELRSGDHFTLTTEDIVGDKTRVSVSFKSLPSAVKKGDTLFLNDGYIQVEVIAVTGDDVLCSVLVGGELRSRKGLNLPGIDLGISAFTERDQECLNFALENGVDAVSQSFVEGPADIEAVRNASAELGYRPFIIAKIERSGALKNIEAIIDAADGIMIARGDLGVEVPIEQIAVIQKYLTRQANMRAKPVITATQMLESMTDNRRPTRAEATDVSNAILDGTDCVMLSAESAMGRYPVDAVAMLAKIAASVEEGRPHVTVRELYREVDLTGKIQPEHLVAIGVEAGIEYVSPAAVFVPTHSGATARSIARFRFPVWTVAISSQESTCRQLQFSSGVYPVHETDHPEHWNDFVRDWLSKYDLFENLAILTEGPSTKYPEANHRIEIIDLNRGS
ncbi:Pyruvate kinase [uncultured Desulfobacterium sp.]|uniref:Pyruvate kinase n=1 Tax=uncultured Desulfobacterium sp. TaxID=201089 RepID=A0A445N1K7_9BACT|nr:Pyruvate kinase [uncultured Desulfobacterium sp.]